MAPGLVRTLNRLPEAYELLSLEPERSEGFSDLQRGILERNQRFDRKVGCSLPDNLRVVLFFSKEHAKGADKERLSRPALPRDDIQPLSKRDEGLFECRKVSYL